MIEFDDMRVVRDIYGNVALRVWWTNEQGESQVQEVEYDIDAALSPDEFLKYARDRCEKSQEAFNRLEGYTS